MDNQIVAVFCLCDDMLKALHHTEDPQRQVTDTEVMIAAIWNGLRNNTCPVMGYIDQVNVRLEVTQGKRKSNYPV